MKPFKPVMADPMLEPWRWRHEEALEGVGAICMDEAPDGTLWFGGTGCIASYDGGHIERIAFDQALLSQITHNRLVPWAKALLLMEDGSPLVLIGESVVLWRNGEWRVIVPDVGRSVFSCRLVRAEDGAIWVLVPGALWRIEKTLSTAEKVMQISGQRELSALCFDPSGDAWVVERSEELFPELIHIPIENGLPMEGSTRPRYRIPSEHTMNDTHLTCGQDGRIWYADSSRTSSLLVFDRQQKKWANQMDEGDWLGVFSLVSGHDSSIWGGTEGGIVRWEPGVHLRLYPRGTLGLPLVPMSLYEASNQRLWVIGRVGYVYSVDLGTREWMTLEGLQYHCETADGRMWYILDGLSVVSHDSRSNEWWLHDFGDLQLKNVYSLSASSDGLIWAIGHNDSGAAISVFDGTGWELHSHPEFARWVEPRGGFEADDGTLWFGAGGRMLADVPGAGGILQYGMNEAGKGRLIKHHAPPHFPYYVTAFAQTPDESMWLGSTLVFRLDKNAREPVPLRGLGGENTVAMAVDHAGTLWVAKEHFGVCRWLGNDWEVFTAEDGVASLLLSDLLVLRDGSLLASSDRGISRFDGKSWTPHAYSERFGMVKRWSGMKLSADGSLWLNYSDDEQQSPLLFQGKNRRRGTVRHIPESMPPETRMVDYLKKVAQPGNSHITWMAHDPWGETPLELMQYSWRLDGGEWSAFAPDTGRTFLDLIHGPHVLEVRARDDAFNIDPTPDRAEFVVVAPLWLQPWFIAMNVLLIGGTILLIWMMIYFHDKRLKDRQRHLVELDRLKTSFFTNLSHELRTPLSVMLSPLESLRRSETSEVRREKLSMVIRSAERVTALLTQLLDFRKLEQGKMTMDLCSGDMVEPVRSAVDLLMPMAHARRVECRLECPKEYTGLFDEDKLRKITSNLVGNAIKYTRPGGEVVVRLDFSGGDPEQNRLILMVEDSGAGIEPEHLEHIFDRFFRGSEKTAVDGSGIGLNLVKELVELWGGTIRAESPIHQDTKRPGARFVVDMPVGGNEDFVELEP